MRTFKIIGRFASATIFAGLLFTACKRSDTKLQQDLVGTWNWDAAGVHGTVTYDSAGKFTAQTYQNGRVLSTQGTRQIRDGVMISTVLTANDTNLVGMTDRCKIVRLQSHELILHIEGSQTDLRLER